MNSEPARQSSRRHVLAAALGAVGGLLASTAHVARTEAATGDPMILGIDNEADATTRVTSVVDVEPSTAIAFEGHSEGFGSVGVRGSAFFGVEGETDDESGVGVIGRGRGGGIGVRGTSPDTGVVGAGGRAGVVGAGSRWGVRGGTDQKNGIGVFGIVDRYGTAGEFTAAHLTATALRVNGKTHLNRSGRLAFASGQRRRRIAVPGAWTTTMVFATIQGYRPGFRIDGAWAGGGYVNVVLNKAVPTDTLVAYLLLD